MMIPESDPRSLMSRPAALWTAALLTGAVAAACASDPAAEPPVGMAGAMEGCVLVGEAVFGEFEDVETGRLQLLEASATIATAADINEAWKPLSDAVFGLAMSTAAGDRDAMRRWVPLALKRCDELMELHEAIRAR